MLRRLVNLLFRRSALEDDMEEELRFHIESRAEELARSGLSMPEALRRARLEFGGVESYKEQCREVLRGRFIDECAADLRFAWRGICRDRSLTATVLVTIALGVGITTAAFTVVKAVLIQPLPYREPDRLVKLWNLNEQARKASPFASDFPEWQQRSGIFESLAAVHVEPRAHLGGPVRVTPAQADPNAEAATMAFVSPDFFRTVGVWPRGGSVPFGRDAVILQDEYWHRRFAGNPAVLGQQVWHGYGEGSGWSFQLRVAGVMPPGFVIYSRAVDYFCPLDLDEVVKRFPDDTDWEVIGRLKAGMLLDVAQVRADAFSRQLQNENPTRNRGWHVKLVPVEEEAAGQFRPFMTAVFGAVMFALLIVCANVANLLLVKAAERTKEMAVRSAVGASRRRLIRQLLLESTLLALGGGVAGIALARLLVGYLRTQLPNRHTWGGNFLQAEAIHVDGTVIVFAIVATLMVGTVFGLIPALRASAPDIVEGLKDAGPGVIGRAGRQRLAQGLVLAQVVLACVLVTGATLLVRSAVSLANKGPGFESIGRLQVRVRPSEPLLQRIIVAQGRSATQAAEDLKAGSPALWAAKYTASRAVLRQVRSLPGVLGVTGTSARPMGGGYWLASFTLEADQQRSGGPPPQAVIALVEANYFKEMGIPILEGRSFGREDEPDSPRVVIVSAGAARRFWPGQNAIGRRVRIPHSNDPAWFTVIGIAGDTRDDGIDKPPVPHVYQPWAQNRWWWGPEGLIVRTSVAPLSVAKPLRAAITDQDPDAIIMGIYSLDNVVSESTWRLHHAALLTGGVAGLAWLLSLVGVYGVVSHSVRERTREIGLRIALGARRSTAATLVVRELVITIAFAIPLGLGAAAAVSGSLRHLLFGVGPLDTASFVAAAVALLIAVSAASCLPARRAVRIDPLTALRHE